MRSLRTLVILGGLSVLGVAGYAIYSGSASKVGTHLFSVDATDKIEESRGSDAQVFKALRQDISRLRAELSASNKQDDGDGVMAQRLGRLEDQVAAIQQQLQKVLETAGPEELEPVPFSDAEMIAVIKEDAEAQEFLHREYIAKVESVFQSEPVEDWSFETVELIGQAFDSDELEKAEVVDTQCRSTLCRVEVEHVDQSDAANFELFLSDKVASEFSSFTVDRQVAEDGRVKTVMYMARDGSDLPE